VLVLLRHVLGRGGDSRSEDFEGSSKAGEKKKFRMSGERLRYTLSHRRARGGCGWFRVPVVSPKCAVFGSEAMYITVVVHG
jgi:hypothetical protein